MSYEKKLGLGWPEHLFKTLEFRMGAMKDAKGYDNPTAEISFFWTGGYYARIFMIGHESHYGTHWSKVRWVKYKMKDFNIELKGDNLHIVAMAEYFRARTGEGYDYLEENSPAKEYEEKIPAVKAALGID